MTYDGTRTIQDPDLVDTFDLDDGRTAYLLYDHDCESPRGNAGDVSTIVQLSNRYLDADDPGDVAPALERWVGTSWGYRRHNDADVLVERYARMFCDVVAFTRWDGQGGQSDGSWGYAWLTADAAREAGLPFGEHTVEDALDSEVSEYAAWAAGECYGVIVTDADGEEVESCWGFIGYDYAVKVAEAGLDY